MMVTEGACSICRREQVRSPCCRGALLRRSRRLRCGIDGTDLISALPDDLLLQILARLRCARAAAHTGLLSRRWRGLWTQLPELIFHNATPDHLDAALTEVACPAVSLLDIIVPDHHGLAPARIASLLRAAARLAPAELIVDLEMIHSHRSSEDAELPCFHRASSIKLFMDSVVHFKLPPTGNFTALEVLSLCSCHIDLADLLPRCTSLRELRMLDWPNQSSIVIHSPLLEELHVQTSEPCRRLDILAPLLKKLWFGPSNKLQVEYYPNFHDEFQLSYTAPVLEDLSWWGTCDQFSIVGCSEIWYILTLTLAISKPLGPRQLTNDTDNSCLQQLQRPNVSVLSVCIRTHHTVGGAVRSIVKQLFQSLVANFSILKLNIMHGGHAYGAAVLHLLGFCTSIQRLELKLYEWNGSSHVNCPCDQTDSWRNENVSLTGLKEVEIQGFEGKSHEIDLLEVILRSAMVLESVTVNWRFYKVSPNDTGCMGIRSILKAYPSVKCNIYSMSGELVQYP